MEEIGVIKYQYLSVYPRMKGGTKKKNQILEKDRNLKGKIKTIKEIKTLIQRDSIIPQKNIEKEKRKGETKKCDQESENRSRMLHTKTEKWSRARPKWSRARPN